LSCIEIDTRDGGWLLKNASLEVHSHAFALCVRLDGEAKPGSITSQVWRSEGDESMEAGIFDLDGQQAESSEGH
jgi:hypothetical protein